MQKTLALTALAAVASAGGFHGAGGHDHGHGHGHGYQAVQPQTHSYGYVQPAAQTVSYEYQQPKKTETKSYGYSQSYGYEVEKKPEPKIAVCPITGKPMGTHSTVTHDHKVSVEVEAPKKHTSHTYQYDTYDDHHHHQPQQVTETHYGYQREYQAPKKQETKYVAVQPVQQVQYVQPVQHQYVAAQPVYQQHGGHGYGQSGYYGEQAALNSAQHGGFLGVVDEGYSTGYGQGGHGYGHGGHGYGHGGYGYQDNGNNVGNAHVANHHGAYLQNGQFGQGYGNNHGHAPRVVYGGAGHGHGYAQPQQQYVAVQAQPQHQYVAVQPVQQQHQYVAVQPVQQQYYAHQPAHQQQYNAHGGSYQPHVSHHGHGVGANHSGGARGDVRWTNGLQGAAGAPHYAAYNNGVNGY